MTDRRTEIIAKLEENLKNTISFFRSLSGEQLSAQVYADGAKWTVKQVLAHFITIERSMHWLFKNILSEAHRKILMWIDLILARLRN